MTTVGNIRDFLNTLAPESMKQAWDHVGLLCGRHDREVRRVLIALDPFAAVCREAKEVGAQLLLTHHPAIWELKEVNDRTEQGENLLFLAENGIAALNAHTNLDYAPDGVNDCLAACLGLTQVRVLDPVGTTADGRAYGLLRAGNTAERSPFDFAAFVKQALGCEGLRYADGGRPVRTVAVGGGACSSCLEPVAAAGCDAFVTADVKYNAFHDAEQLGITLVDAGHFQTESPVCAYLAARLAERFPQLEIVRSRASVDPIHFL